MDWKTGDIAKRIGVHPNTVRTWADQYSERMSAKAVSSRRRFTEDDLRVLATIAQYREQGIDPAQITTLLIDPANLVKSLPPMPSPEETEAREGMKLVALPQLERALDQIQQLEVERNRLIVERDQAVERREEMNDQIRMLEREIGELRGKLVVIGADRRSSDYWLTRIAVAVLLTIVAVVLIGGVILLVSARA